MFTNIYYNAFKNKLYLWENINGKKKKQVITPNFKYYIKDKTGKSPKKDIYNTPVIEKNSDSKSGMKSLMDAGIYCYESDIQMDMKYLHEKYESQDIKPDYKNLRIAALDIECASPDEFPKPEQARHPINLISIWFSDDDKLYTFGLNEYTGDSDEVKNYCYCSTEKKLLENFFAFLKKKDPDVLTGWYVESFDVPYIVNRCKNIDIDYNLFSPIGIVNDKKYGRYEIAGISILDYIELYKARMPEKKESYKLNNVCMEELGEGKLEYDGRINDLFVDDWNKFVEYNVQDVILVKKLHKKFKFIELAYDIAYASLISPEKTFSSMAIHTGYILKFLHNKNLVMPARSDAHDKTPIEGGYVFANPGLWEYIVSFDVESMYPTNIRMFNIGNETLRKNPANTENLISTPLKGVYYDSSKQSIISEIVTEIFNERKVFKLKKSICSLLDKKKTPEDISTKFKMSLTSIEDIISEIDEEDGNADYYDLQQYVRKIMINSMYGVLASPYFAFYNTDCARTITLSGQELIKFLSDSTNSYFKNHFWKNKKYFAEIDEKNKITEDVVKLVDTDSIYLSLKIIIEKLGLTFKDNREFVDWAAKFSDEFLDDFYKKLSDIFCKKYNIKNLINFKREKICIDQFVTSKKRYIARVVDDEGTFYENPKLVTKGLEIVRTDTPMFCRKKILEAINKLFDLKDKNKVVDILEAIKADFIKEPIENIATPTGVSDYSKFCKNDFTKGIKIPKSCPIHVRASINYNYLVLKNKWKLQQVVNGTKVRYIYVLENNPLRTNVIGFVGNWPEELNKLFKIDYETQWEKEFQNSMQRFFDIIEWGTINFSAKKLRRFFDE